MRWRVTQRWLQRLTVWLGGIGVALLAILFAKTTEIAFHGFERIVAWQPAAALVVVPAGLALVAALTIRYVPGAQGSGIPQTIAALSLSPEQRGSVLSVPIALAKIALTSIGLAAGASVGREGPTVQVGASIMVRLGKLLHLAVPVNERSMTLAGGAAGIAAAFNTPLAGVVFAIEELSRSYEGRTSGTVLTAVILSGITSLALVGNSPYFGSTDAALDLGRTWWLAVGGIGLAGGVLGGLFAKILIFASRVGLPGPIGALSRRHPVVFAALCGVMIAIVGMVSGNTTYGTGYEAARALLEGGDLPASFFPLKMAATVFSYLSGIPGGLFSPSLSAGAGLGETIAGFMPGTSVQACILLGMAAYFTGVVQSPITAAIIVMEMTDNQQLTVALLATSFLAFGVSRLICPQSLYKALAERFLSRTVAAAEADQPPPALRTDLADPVKPRPKDQ